MLPSAEVLVSLVAVKYPPDTLRSVKDPSLYVIPNVHNWNSDPSPSGRSKITTPSPIVKTFPEDSLIRPGVIEGGSIQVLFWYCQGPFLLIIFLVSELKDQSCSNKRN